MSGLYLSDLDALREFSRTFSGSCNNLEVVVFDTATSITEILAWMELCREEANRELELASSNADQCRDELDYCLSQEDEDYIPDCSYEESALEEALVCLEMWRQRNDR